MSTPDKTTPEADPTSTSEADPKPTSEAASAFLLDAGTAADIQRDGSRLVSGGPVPIVVFWADEQFLAVDNRCPHMGFPLNRGTVKDGVLTCHWHHARFDLRSGCTFDLFADDVRAYPVEVKDGRVLVDTAAPRRDPVARGFSRLEEAMDHNLRLPLAKAIVALVHAGVGADEVARVAGLYGTRRRREGWASGLTILAAMANVTDHLEGDEAIAALYQGCLHVAVDCQGRAPHVALRPLESPDIPPEALRRWFRDLVEVRNPDGAERVLLAAIDSPGDPSQIVEMVLAAATDHFYLDGGHVVDFLNKAFELLDRIGWQHAGQVLPSVIRPLTRAARSEEQNSWRSPVDLVALLRDVFENLETRLAEGQGHTWPRPAGFTDTLLGDDPVVIVAALDAALAAGAQPVQLAAAVAQAAALRIARFHVQNEFSDWIAVLHTFTYANAMHQLLRRVSSPEMLRGVYHGALRVYLDRFLNVPPARLPAGSATAADRDPTWLRAAFLELLDRQQQVDAAGQMVQRYLDAGGEPGPLFGALAEALLREDAEFHSFQMLEAAIRQFGHREDAGERRVLMVAAARYLAAKAPTQRERLQTLRIALRLHRGEPVYEEA